MANVLIINEKPSVSRDFAHALGVREKERHDGYIEGYSDFFWMYNMDYMVYRSFSYNVIS